MFRLPVSITVACAFALFALRGAAVSAAVPAPPAWAYPINPAASGDVAIDNHTPRHVPGSRASFTDSQLNDEFVGPDWHPQDHPAAPAIVTHGRRPDVYACGHCHRMGGTGGPENAKLAGLPAEYLIRQLQDYHNGVRGTAVPGRAPQTFMIKLARSLRPAEMRSAANYFSHLTPSTNIRIVETATVVHTHVEGWRLGADPSGAREPIGPRIIELPDDPPNFERRDSRTTFTAYVPPGSLARGKRLATLGDGGTLACVTCHGPQLLGLALAPPIAGRSPTYLVRQLYEIQTGIRAGVAAGPMKTGIATLSLDDMIAVAAWTASLPAAPPLTAATPNQLIRQLR